MIGNALGRVYRSKLGKAGLVLIILNEIRGLAVVASIVTTYFGISLPFIN